MSRVWAIHSLAIITESKDAPLGQDLARVAVAFGVGAMDAYMCDALTDTLARCLKLCQRNKRALPNDYAKMALPIGPQMTDYRERDAWGLRMAAYALMERDDLVKLSRLKELFNPALPQGQKLWNDLAQSYVDLDRKRLTGFRKRDFAQLAGKAKSDGPKQVSSALLKRMGVIVQRRHDVVHNCDRPRTAKQRIALPEAQKMLSDVESFVTIFDDHLHAHRRY